MTGFNRGDVVLVKFVFSDESGEKRRPALILSSKTYHNTRDEAIIAAITSRTDRILTGDHLITDWQSAGLLFPSVVTGVIRTIKRNMIDRRLGSIVSPDMEAINTNIRLIFGLT